MATKERQRKSYTLQQKLECLDFYKDKGKDHFWHEFDAKVTKKTFYQWKRDEQSLRAFAATRKNVDNFRRNRSSKYLVMFPELYQWAQIKKSVSRKELKEEGSKLMVKYGLVNAIRTAKGYLSFNDMVLQKFINDFGSDFISKPPELASYKNQASQFKCGTCGYRLATKETLRRHQLVHSYKRYWLCPLCPTTFKHYHGAVNHGKIKHNARIVPIKSSAKVEDDDDDEEVEDEYDEMIDTHFTDDDFKIEPSEQTNGRKRKSRKRRRDEVEDDDEADVKTEPPPEPDSEDAQAQVMVEVVATVEEIDMCQVKRELNNENNNRLFHESSSVALKNFDIRTALTRGRTDSCSSISSCRSVISLPESLTTHTLEKPSCETVPKILDYQLADLKSRVCFKCELKVTVDQLTQCKGVCRQWHHKACLSAWEVCDYCQNGIHQCHDCWKPVATYKGVWDGQWVTPETSEAIKCGHSECASFYHLSCILPLKQATYDARAQSWTCPHHHCQFCGSDGPDLYRCTRCPVAFHGRKECVPAGTFFLGGNKVLCPAHFKRDRANPLHRPIHSNHCFVCDGGGELIICDGCPAAYHQSCIEEHGGDSTGLDTLDNSWFCPTCVKGSPFRYGDLVWAKTGNFRWWPAQVVEPPQIPDPIYKLKSSPGEFVLKYFGTGDCNWMSRLRCFPYRGKIDDPHFVAKGHDKMAKNKKKLTKTEETFKTALIQAETTHLERIKSVPSKVRKWRPIERNKVTKQIRRKIRAPLESGEDERCSCTSSMTSSSSEPCGLESNCENRALLIECGGRCPSGDRCQNKSFERELNPAHFEQFTTEWGGQGLKTTVNIKRGAFIIEYVGEVITVAESQKRFAEDHAAGIADFYQISLDKNYMIDAGRHGNLARFVNHSCAPNTSTQCWSVQGAKRIGIFAECDIKAGEELTFNYHLVQAGIDRHGETTKTKCYCGAPVCAGFIGDKIKKAKKKRKKTA